MSGDFVDHIHTESTLAALPRHDVALELSVEGRVLGEVLERRAELPGVVVTEKGEIRGSISRGQYLRLVGRHLGLELYHFRPLRTMFDDVAGAERPLVLPSDTRIQAAVRRALDRPRHQLYEPVIVAESGANGGSPKTELVDFPDLLRADSRISVLRGLQMRQILATVQDGLLLVDREHRIGPEASEACARILESEELAGRPFEDVLASILDAERVELARDYLVSLFDPNVIEKLVVAINPLGRVVARFSGGREKHLAFGFRRSVRDGRIVQVLVRVEDRSREVQLARDVEAREKEGRERADLLLELAGAEPGGLAGFLDDLARLGAELQEGGRSEENGEEARRLYRRLHALKGEAGVLCLGSIRSQLHVLEDRLAAPVPSSPDGHSALADVAERLGRLHGDVEAALEPLRRIRSRGVALGTSLVTSPVATPVEAIGNGEAPLAKGSGVETREPRGSSSGDPESAPDRIADLRRVVDEVAAAHGKRARLHVRDPGSGLAQGVLGVRLRDVLPQLVRNAVIHGLEVPGARLVAGKPETGLVQIEVRADADPGWVEVVVQDDGRGLDLELLARTADEIGVGWESEDDLRELVFRPGVSTADRLTLDAGRGVGLDMVRAELGELGGCVRVHSEAGAWCAFQILLPRTEVDP